MMVTAEASSTSAFMKTAKASLTNMP